MVVDVSIGSVVHLAWVTLAWPTDIVSLVLVKVCQMIALVGLILKSLDFS